MLSVSVSTEIVSSMDLYYHELYYVLAAVFIILLIDFITARSFEPLWGVMRVATERLANAHHLVVVKLHELAKEVKEYGDKQKDRHKTVRNDIKMTIYLGLLTNRCITFI